MKPLFFKHQTYFEIAFWVAVQTLHAVINANSVLHEYAKRGEAIATWQPYLWEFSSMLAILVLIPLIVRFNQKFPLYIKQFKRNLLPHVLITVIFSIVHIALMVGLRKAGYWWLGDSYDFGDWQSEFFYEYRKDLLTYIGIISTIYIYRFIIARIKGEATIVQTVERERQTSDRLLIKKFGKEFIIRINEIEWIEAAGNYMNIHIQEAVYPLRETMAYLEKNLPENQFIRIHRSYMINIDAVNHIEASDGADSTVVMNSGDKLKLSRRYKESFQTKMRL